MFWIHVEVIGVVTPDPSPQIRTDIRAGTKMSTKRPLVIVHGKDILGKEEEGARREYHTVKFIVITEEKKLNL